MKNINSIAIACLILCSINLIIAQPNEPILISPYIGTTMDRVEREFFNVLPAIEGFEESKFYLNPDNSLKAVIKLNRNGVKSDTILERYSSPEQLELLIVSNILKNISDDKNKVVSIKLKEENYEIKEQRIYTINDSSMFTIHKSLLEDKPSYLKYGMVKGTRLLEIENVILPSYSAWDYIQISTGVGAGVGLLAGFAYGIITVEKNSTNDENLKELEATVNFGRSLYSAAIGAVIGAGVGLVSGFIIGPIFGEDDQPIDPNTPSGLAELEPYISLPKKNRQEE